jgi:hypothetical protein
MDIKANWARARNKYDDPFGPPLLTLDDQHQLRPTTVKLPTAPAPKTVIVHEIIPSPTMMKDSLLLSEDDHDDGPDSEIERITNVKLDENESSRPITPTHERQVKSPFSQLFSTEPAKVPARSAPSTNKSDSDDDDQFIAMLKRK